MSIIDSLAQRRTYYSLTKDLPVSEQEILDTIARVTQLVPDAFDMRSSRLVVALGDQNAALWDSVIDAFDGTIVQYKQDCFHGCYGTILFFYDNAVVKALQEKHPTSAPNLPGWATQASAMLQISIWSALRELGVGASIHHYNPIIDDRMKAMFDLPEDYVLVAQMPFGGIGGDPRVKDPQNVMDRIKVCK